MNDNATTTEVTPEVRIFKIHIHRMDDARAKLATLNRRGAKLGCPPAVLTITGYHDEPVFEKFEGRYVEPRRQIGVQRYALVTVTGEAPKFAGWTFGATIEHAEAGNLLRKAPGCKIELDPRFRTCGPSCEHCNTTRNRKDTFVMVHDTGTQKLVGRDCIRDFLGHQSPENILQRFTWGASLDDCLGEFEGDGAGDYGPMYRPLLSVNAFLAFAACATRHFGYVSRSREQAMAQAGGNLESTAATAMFWMEPPKGLSDKQKAALRKPEQVDEDRAVAARNFVLNTLGVGDRPAASLSDFENNLLVACRSDFIEPRNSGLLAFVPEYHARETEKSLVRARQASEASQAVYFPAEPKTRVKGIKVRYVRSIGYESQFGTGFFHLFDTTVAGGTTRLKWSTGTAMDNTTPGEEFTATFTVKAHDEYKGAKQTSITRVKFDGGAA